MSVLAAGWSSSMQRSALLLLLFSVVGCATLPSRDRDLFAAAAKDDTGGSSGCW